MEQLISLIVAFFIETDRKSEAFNTDLHFYRIRNGVECELDIHSRTGSGVTLSSNCDIW